MKTRWLIPVLLLLTLPDCGLRERIAPLPTATAVYPSPVQVTAPPLPSPTP